MNWFSSIINGILASIVAVLSFITTIVCLLIMGAVLTSPLLFIAFLIYLACKH